MEIEDARLSSDLYEPQKNDPVGGVKEPGKVKTKGKVTFALQKNTVRSQSVDEGMLYRNMSCMKQKECIYKKN